MPQHEAIVPWGKLFAGSITLDLDRYTAHVDGQAVDLTRIEFDLLEFLMRRPNRVVSQTELLQHVFDRHANAHHGSLVRVHVAHLRRKLGTASSAIRTVRGRGLVLGVDLGDVAQNQRN